jgi:hypothetical protein
MSQFDTAPGPDTSAPEPAATITAAEEQAKEFIEGFRVLVAKLPKFDLPHPLTLPLSRRHRNVPANYAKTVADMVALSPDLQAIKQFSLDDNKSDQQQIEAWTAVDQEITTFQKAIRFFVALKKSKTNTAATHMQIFANALSQDAAYAHLLPLVATMKEARRTKKSKAKPEPQSTSGTTPQNGGAIPPH